MSELYFTQNRKDRAFTAMAGFLRLKKEKNFDDMESAKWKELFKKEYDTRIDWMDSQKERAEKHLKWCENPT